MRKIVDVVLMVFFLAIRNIHGGDSTLCYIETKEY